MVRLLWICCLLWPLPTIAAPWALDPATTVAVDVPWEDATVTVRFPPPTGQVDFDPDRPETARATVTVSAKGATTGVPLADALIRSQDYLGVDRWPEMSFQLERLKKQSTDRAEIDGTITFRGVTKPVSFDARVTRYGPSATNPDRFDAGFDLSGEIDRTEFGSTGGLPDVPAVLPVRIRLLMHSD